MRTRTEGPANQYLLILIRTIREIDRLERTYGDPHKRLNAHCDFQKLYLRDPTNFVLPDALRTQMGIYQRQYRDQYDEYQSRLEAKRLTHAAATAILPIPISKPASCYNCGKPSYFVKDY
ncbi:hypothetical protein K469DRAFT_715812 [Zopfia rhizophila CBS 207.26]|uniref:Uncharacterized protein n=1 Tax=Zopfia rhizophila CBS 207.26 TaxID=1314779 RepID=A0A6A6DLD1_9PEZI|nr:hypothetical protein K469DRAFT_715812 [Zopfia rhizophila CBS 207.26]